MFTIFTTTLLTLVVSPFLLSIFEWAFHKHVMHKDLSWFNYPFERHELVHHRIFKSDGSYHLQNHLEKDMEKDKETIPMAIWNFAPLILLAMIPFELVASMLWIFGFTWATIAALIVTSFIVCGAYYGAYERLHWCMHLPRERRIEMSPVFRRLNGHHILHHRYMRRYNFNVVFPFADWLFGTLIYRAKTRFVQVIDPSVPDLQPLEIN